MDINATVMGKTAVIYMSNAVDSEVIGEVQPGEEVILIFLLERSLRALR